MVEVKECCRICENHYWGLFDGDDCDEGMNDDGKNGFEHVCDKFVLNKRLRP
jgi:hypothetical protein